MLKALTPVRKTAGLLFLSLSFCYMALTPGTIGGRGYVDEEMASGKQMLVVFNAWVKGRPIPPMVWSRHGPIPVLLDLPFIRLGKEFVNPDFDLSLQSSVLTAALVTILFLWLRKLCSPGMSLILSLTAAFGTMLWPYAYIGLETKQSLFVLLAGYMALANGQIRGWPRLLLFALCCGLAMTLKSTGIVMWPALAYLVFVQFRNDWRPRIAQLAVLTLVVVGIVAVGTWSRNLFWTPIGGGAKALLPWIISSPIQLFTNAIGLLGSSSKGLLVYAPILIVSLCLLSSAYRANRPLVIFAVLVTACYGGFVSLLTVSADEVWGPRYMHFSIAPLVLCIGAAWPRANWRRVVPIAFLATAGLTISFLGAFYYYGNIAFAMTTSRQNTLEWINGDPVWNVVQFDSRVFHLWMEGGNTPVPWTPTHMWVWTPQPGAQTWIPLNLRDYSLPQSALLQFWDAPKSGEVLTAFRFLEFSMVAGPLLLLWTFKRTIREGLTATDP